MPKMIYNETNMIIQFNTECSRKVWLYPKGSVDPKRPDHAQISSGEAKHPHIEKFRQAGKISVLGLDQAHEREKGPALGTPSTLPESPIPVAEVVPPSQTEPVAEEPKADAAPPEGKGPDPIAEEPKEPEEPPKESNEYVGKKKGKGKKNY